MGCIQDTTVFVSSGIDVTINNRIVLIKGSRGILTHHLHDSLECKKVDNRMVIFFCTRRRCIGNISLLGTTRSLLQSMMIGVSIGFVKKLQLVGVGYRVVLDQNILVLSVGFSHVVNYKLPDGIDVVCPSLTDIILNSADKQLVGQVAADLRSIRPPEPFSGKGIRYADEVLRIKEVKKK